MRVSSVWFSGLGVVVLWASAFPAIRVAAPALGAFGLSLARLAVASVALLALAPLAGVRLPRRADLPLIGACGLTGMTAYQLLLNQGEIAVPAGTASISVAAAPLVSVAVAAAGLGERISGTQVTGGVVALGGVSVVCLSRSAVSLSASVLIVVAATVAQGLYHPLTKSLLRRYTGLEVATYAMVAGTVTSLPLLPWAWPGLVGGRWGSRSSGWARCPPPSSWPAAGWSSPGCC